MYNNNDEKKAPETTKEQIYKPHDYLPLPPPNFDIFHYIGERKYAGDHLFPLDDNELDRLQLEHYIHYHVWGNYFSAPVERLLNADDTKAKVLDVGCGPAIWTLEMASKFPNSKFTGIDIAPTYPIQIKPLNVEFLQSNIKKDGLPYEDNTFDYVFCRFANFSYNAKTWKLIISEICRVCKVGGYIEFMEKDVDFNVKDTKKDLNRFIKNLHKKNYEPMISKKIIQYINETKNFADIEHVKKDIPTGEWGDNKKDKFKIGIHNKKAIEWGANNLKDIMVRDCGYDEKEWDMNVKKFLKELDEEQICDNVHRIWARKENEIKVEVGLLPNEFFFRFQRLKKFLKNSDYHIPNFYTSFKRFMS